MALGMKVKEDLIRERGPSREDIEEVGVKIREIADTLDHLENLIFDEEGPEYIEARKKLFNSRVNIGYIEKSLGLR